MQKKPVKNNKFKDFISSPIGKTILIATPILIAVAVILVCVLLPKYNITVSGATEEASFDEDGAKVVTIRVKKDCNASVIDDKIVCEDATIEGAFDSNRDVELSLSDNAQSAKIEDGTFSFAREGVENKKVVIRADEIKENDTKEYVITLTSDGKEVLRNKLIVETVYTDDDLALLNKIPTGDEISNALKTISTVDGTCIVTEENDPNGNLNKTGGYIAAVYFSDTRANLEMKNNPYANYKDICDQGTVAGGQIEVYANTEDANKRAGYLNSFSGGILSSGDNYVYGTSVIRISNEMTATQMAELKDIVVKTLTE